MSARRFVRMAAIGVVLAWLAGACSGSAREKTIAHTLTAIDASASAFVKYDHDKQQAIVAGAANRAEGEAQLAEWRSKQIVVEIALASAYRAVALASEINDDQAVSGMLAAVAVIAEELTALGITIK